jgi:hypothetical protein
MKYGVEGVGGFIPWQPSTWPEPRAEWNEEFAKQFRWIIETTVIGELENVIGDVLRSHGSIEHRGHVLLIPLLCAIDTLSSYAHGLSIATRACPKCGRGDRVGPRFERFVTDYFPSGYAPYAHELYGLYRNASVHSWHLFQVALFPGHEEIREEGGSLSFGLLNLAGALRRAVEEFMAELNEDEELQRNVLTRYRELRRSAVANERDPGD